MKAEIHISGQINGNNRLVRAIRGNEEHYQQMNFYGWRVVFKTKKAAYKALWEAYKWLRSEEPEFAKYGISYCPKSCLSYDASKAVII